jgi:hypothetical protein
LWTAKYTEAFPRRWDYYTEGGKPGYDAVQLLGGYEGVEEEGGIVEKGWVVRNYAGDKRIDMREGHYCVRKKLQSK